jgi:hypothetical protein
MVSALAIDPMRSKDFDRLMAYLDDQIRLYRNRHAIRQEEIDHDPFGEGFHIGYETALTQARTEVKGKSLDQFVIYARRRAIGRAPQNDFKYWNSPVF